MKTLRYIFATSVTIASALVVMALIGLWLKVAVAMFMFGWNLL